MKLPLILLVLSFGFYAQADTAGPENIPFDCVHFLEGKVFEGQLGTLGEPASTTDVLTFKDGEFISSECQEKCGYSAGDYWVRGYGDVYRVRAETLCENSDALIVWEGVINGNEIEGTFTWINKRWYWTFEKQFWFKGELLQQAMTRQ